jgi:hypothetical protein
MVDKQKRHIKSEIEMDLPTEEGQCPQCLGWFDVEWFDDLPPGGMWWADNRNGGGCPGCGYISLVESECNFRKKV